MVKWRGRVSLRLSLRAGYEPLAHSACSIRLHPQKTAVRSAVLARLIWMCAAAVRLRSRSQGNGSRNKDVHAKNASRPACKTAALTKTQAEHKKWLKAHRIKVTRIHSAPDARSVIASAGILPSVI